MDKFASLDRAAHAGANGHNHRPEATPAQRIAGNYLKGREVLHGLRLAIESPRGTLRHWQAEDGTSGSNLMKFHYGYIEGTLGNDGDELDVFIGPAPELQRVYVVNQNVRGKFDEHKIMLGFPDQRTAEAGYLSNFTAGWPGLASCVACSITQLKWWIANGNKARPLTQDQLPYEGMEMQKQLWDSANLPLRSTLEQVLYRLRGHDGADGLLFDAVRMADILEDSDGVLTLDALVIPMARLEQRMQLMQKTLDRASKGVKVAGMQVSDPFTQRGSTNVAVIYELTDGQTVSVFFHNPDVTPKKIGPGDDVISWKWMLNKKDITVAVAPERGRDLDVRTVAARIMQLADKNSARFIAANGKRAEKMEVIASLKTELDTKKATLADLESQIAAAQAAREAEGLGDPEEPLPAGLLSEREQADIERRLSLLADRTGKMSDDQLGLVASILGVVNAQKKGRDELLDKIFANHPDDIENAIERWEATNATTDVPAAPAPEQQPEPAVPDAQGTVPDDIARKVSDALQVLNEVKEGITAAATLEAKFGSPGRYQWDALQNRKADIARAQKVLATFREFAPANGVDAEAFITAQGGEPDLTPSPEAQKWAEPAPAADPAPEFALTGESADEARSRIAQEEAAAAAEKAGAAAAEKAARAEQEQKEIAARQAASAENFELGQNPIDALSGQQSVFDVPEAMPAAEPESAPAAEPDPRAGAIAKLQSVIDGTADLGDTGLSSELMGIHAAHKDDADMLALFKQAVKAYSAYAVAKANAALAK